MGAPRHICNYEGSVESQGITYYCFLIDFKPVRLGFWRTLTECGGKSVIIPTPLTAGNPVAEIIEWRLFYSWTYLGGSKMLL